MSGSGEAVMFRDGWVEDLLLASARLAKAALVDGAVTDVDGIAAGLRRVVEAFATSTNRPVARVFVGHGQRVDLLERLSHCDPEPALGFEEWLSEVLGEDAFCLALNGVPSWDDDLHEVLTAGVVRPLIEAIGVPVGGLDFYSFIANAGQTPFGVHADREPSLLLHLGPADKECLVWNRQVYARLVESEGRIFDPERDDRRFDPETIAEHAQRLVMKPGDALLIPAGDFHMFVNKGFSAFIGLSLLPATRGAAVAEAVKLLLRDQAAAPIANNVEPESVPALRQAVLESLEGIPDLMARTASYAAANMLRLRSNGYLIYKPVLGRATPELQQDDELEIRENFPIRTLRDQDRLLVCLRGRLLDMRYDRHVDEWFAWLAGRRTPFTRAEAVAWLGARGRGKVAGQLLALAVRYRALKGPLRRGYGPNVSTKTRAARKITEQDRGSPIEWSVDGGPLLIRNGAADWPLTRSCAAGDFAVTHGGREVTARRARTPAQRGLERQPEPESVWCTTLQEFLSYCECADRDEMPATEPWYITDWTISEQSEFEAFLPARLPDSLRSWFWRVPAAARPAWEWIFIGPRGSRSDLHVDVMMSSAWNALAGGTKHWRFLSPAASVREGILTESYLDLVDNRQCVEYECTQQAGDLMVVPSGWAHEVVNLDTTVASTGNFVNAGNVAFARRYLQTTGRTAWLKLLDALEHGEREGTRGR